uniref:Transcriptional regulator PhoB-like protein n=2 Tax=environmental samples TaxID=48479 RepID=I3VIN4_9BACT|nr:transcriptional regulator PhoB-like protein [uncultured bacterium F41-01]
MVPSQKTPSQAGAESDLYFGPFRLESSKQLWRGKQLVSVRPRPLAVLRYLAERSSRVVTSDELLKQLWPGIYVSRTVLRVCVRELRQALQDDPTTLQFIETVGRHGYRFIAPIAPTAPAEIRAPVAVGSADNEETKPLELEPKNGHLATPFVGRERELARLQATFARAQRGERQLVFLMGEPGIGKTTVVNRFLAQVQANGPVRMGWGQCIEHYGPGEAYLPLLEAVSHLCREPKGEQVLQVLRRYAPLWLGQLAGLLEAEEREAIQRQLQGSGPERMLRELAEALEVVAKDEVLVVVLEDLQWSDTATLEALAYLAQRRGPVRLCVLGTYRPVEIVMSQHPLRNLVQGLAGRRQCEEVALELLTEAEVEAYLRQRLGPRAVPPELSQLLYRRTNGNALFLVSFVDTLQQQGVLSEGDGQVKLQADRSTLKRLVPTNLQQTILRQIERVAGDEQQLLRVASVGGMTFTAAEMAGVLERPLEEVEAGYDRLASQEQVITEVGLAEEVEGIVTMRYEFRHALYQQMLYEQLGQGRRVRLHRQVGEWKEEHYGERAAESASELAAHFTEGRDYRRAAQYHGQAAESALRRSAYQQATDHCLGGLALLERLPDTPKRQRQELALRMILSATLTASRGFGTDELVQNLARARELCQALHDDATLVSVLVGMGRFYDRRADREAIEQLMGEELRLLGRLQEPRLAIQLYTHLGTSNMARGALRQALEYHARVLELYNPQWHQELVVRFGIDPAVTAGAVSCWSLWLAGWPDQARARVQQACHQARELDHRFSLILAVIHAARVHLWCGEVNDAERFAEEGARLAREDGVVEFIRAGDILLACSRVRRGEPEGGISLLAEMVAQYRSAEILHLFPLHLSSLADAYWQVGRVEEGLATIAEAVHTTETSAAAFWAAEVYRLKGELLHQSSVQSLGSRVKSQKKSKVQGPKSKVCKN